LIESILYLFLMLICFVTVNIFSKQGILLNPGILHNSIICYTSILSSIIFYCGLRGGDGESWSFFSDVDIFNNVLRINCLYLISFSIIYIFLCLVYSPSFTNISIALSHFKLRDISIALITYFLIYFIQVFLEKVGFIYISVYWANVLDVSLAITLIILLIKIKNVRIAFFLLSLFLILLMINDGFNGPGSFNINKGGITKSLVIIFISLSIAGKFVSLNNKHLWFGLILLSLFLGMSNSIEEYINESYISFKSFIIYALQGIEIRMFENQAIIYSLVETGETKLFKSDDGYISNFYLFKGETYLNSLYDLIFPFVNTEPSAANWFASLINDYAKFKGFESNSSYGLSFIAEGYLNFGIYGVYFSGFLGAILLYFCRILLLIKSRFTLFIYAHFLFLCYYIYRMDFNYVLKYIKFGIIAFSISILLYLLIELLLVNFKKNK